jgi:hypothetical protein
MMVMMMIIHKPLLDKEPSDLEPFLIDLLFSVGDALSKM